MAAKVSFDELVETVRKINDLGTDSAANSLFIGKSTLFYRVRRLESIIGIRLYPPSSYSRMTYQGREWLKNV